MKLTNPLSRKHRNQRQRKKASQQQSDTLQQMILVWEKRAKPRLRAEIVMGEGDDTKSEHDKGLLRAYLEVVSTVFVTELVMETAPDRHINKQPLKSEQPRQVTTP